MGYRQEIEELSHRLDAVACFLDDTSRDAGTAKTLHESSRWLRKLSQNICGKGIVGCHGGDDCTWDHK